MCREAGCGWTTVESVFFENEEGSTCLLGVPGSGRGGPPLPPSTGWCTACRTLGNTPSSSPSTPPPSPTHSSEKEKPSGSPPQAGCAVFPPVPLSQQLTSWAAATGLSPCRTQPCPRTKRRAQDSAFHSLPWAPTQLPPRDVLSHPVATVANAADRGPSHGGL